MTENQVKKWLHIRLTYVGRSGTGVMQVVEAANVASSLEKLAKQGIEAYANLYGEDGSRGPCVGSTGHVPGQRGMRWWCDGELDPVTNYRKLDRVALKSQMAHTDPPKETR